MTGSRYTDEQRETALAMLAAGRTQAETARKLGIPKTTVCFWYHNRMKDDEDMIAARSEARRETARRCGKIVDRSLGAIGRRVADADSEYKTMREGLRVIARAAKDGYLGLSEDDVETLKKAVRGYTGVGLRELSGAMKDVFSLQSSLEEDAGTDADAGVQVTFTDIDLAG